jgi:hypothetical protein
MSDQPLLGKSDAVPRRRWRWLLPLVIVVAVVALVVSLVARTQEEDRNSPKAVLDRYLTAVQAGSTDVAYTMLCAHSSTPSKAEFAREVAKERQNFGGIKRHRMGKTKRLADGDQTVSYTIQYHNTYRWYEARMTNDAGAWRVCGFKEIPRPEVRLPVRDLPEPPGATDTGDTTTTL